MSRLISYKALLNDLQCTLGEWNYTEWGKQKLEWDQMSHVSLDCCSYYAAVEEGSLTFL